jgi:transposase
MRADHLGDRHLFLYVIINQLNVMGTTYKDALKFILEKVNPKFSLPESEYEISRQIQSIYKHNKIKKETIDRQPVEYVDNHYRSNTTEWIIKSLRVTDEEQDELSVLKSKEKLAKLRQERRLAKLRQHTQNKKDAERSAINKLAETYSVEEIAERVNLTTASVYKKLNKTPKQIQMEKENAEILRLKQVGKSISDISEEVGLSYAVVKKRLQRMQNVKEETTQDTEVRPESTVSNSFTPETTLVSFKDLETKLASLYTPSPPNTTK